jgi:DegV family protein with EDD domain
MFDKEYPMSFKIITDSCCDLTAEMVAQCELSVANLSVEMDGRVYSNEEMTPVELYTHLRNGKLPKTAAVNPDGWAALIRPALRAGQDVLVLAFSSGLSATYSSAVLAAEELAEKYPERKIQVIDTLCASLGQGMLVYMAAQKRLEGCSFEEVARWTEDNKLHQCHWFTVNDLMFLKRGGRVSAATALAGTLLQIKPVMHVDDAGKLINMAKARGRKASIEALADKVGETAINPQEQVMFICHGDCLEDAQYLKKLVMERYSPKDVIIGYVGPVIASHSGPGTLAMFFLGEKR